MHNLLRAIAGFGAAFVIPSSSIAATVPRAVPDCAVSLPQGQANLRQFAGKVVYVDFWASWCVSCLASFPFMDQLQRELGPQGLQIVAVNMDENAADARRFLASHKPSFPIALGNVDLLGVIEEMMTAIKIQAKEAENSPDNSQPKLPPTRKRGPDLNRPW